MDFNSQKETWNYFKKLTLYITLFIIFTLSILAFFLL